MAFDGGGIKALKPKPIGGKHDADRGKSSARVLARAAGAGKMLNIHVSRRPMNRRSGIRPATARSTIFWPGMASVN